MLTEFEIRGLLREECQRAGSAKHWAAANDLAPSYVGDVLNGNRRPGGKLLTAMGYRKVVRFEEQ